MITEILLGVIFITVISIITYIHCFILKRASRNAKRSKIYNNIKTLKSLQERKKHLEKTRDKLNKPDKSDNIDRGVYQ